MKSIDGGAWYSYIVGYGNLAPSTSSGQTFCIFYALIGIPLMLLLLGGIGEKLHSAAQRIENLKVGNLIGYFSLNDFCQYTHNCFLI